MRAVVLDSNGLSFRNDYPVQQREDEIDCCGSVSGIPTAMRLLRPRGILVVKTTTSEAHGPNLAPIVIDEITVVGSRCGPFEPALDALENDEIEVAALITARFPIEQAEQAFQVATDSRHRKVLLDIAG